MVHPKHMNVTLSGSWELSTDHADDHADGQPVLIHRATGAVFWPDDILTPFPSWGVMPATNAVLRMAKTAKLDAAGQAMVASFCGLRRDSNAA